ncbi:hypothetical protein [Acinetobacter beijerinckii]|uniref:hypothetical protein n=1 Tax=Acinetobacter beijerinckii TaxID=262668 RepID=UPI003AF82001
MTALAFIQNYWIDKAREVVEGAPSNAVYYWEIPRCTHGVYSTSEQNQGRAIVLNDLKCLVEDIDLLLEYKLPEDFWNSDDKYGMEGTSMYLDGYAFYSNAEEKAKLDRLQLALDRTVKAFGGDHV